MGAGTHLSLRGSNLSRFALVLVFVVVLYYFSDLWLPSSANAKWPILHHDEPEPTVVDEEFQESPEAIVEEAYEIPCREAPGADKVLVMLKTGATELYQKLPTHFVTTFQCIPNHMVWSDLEQQFAGEKVHDAVAPVSSSIREEHDDFKLYREIAEWQRDGQDLSKLKGDKGWNLDKWKFLPMLHATFNVASDDIEWFVMMEADTSLSWTNLLLWLKTMDHTEPLYLGAQNYIGDTAFAHGGSGIVISRAAADKIKSARDQIGHETYDQAWEEITGKSCCGDEVVARAFGVLDVNLTAAWPLIQGERVTTVDWTSAHWCAPPITWHHVTPTEVDALWQFESDWTKEHGWEEPYLYRDVFGHFIEQHITDNRTNWNNHSKDRKFVSKEEFKKDEEQEDRDKWDKLKDYEQAAVESESACAEACLKAGNHECIQWMYRTGRCYLGRDIRFGLSDEHEDEHWVSGWMQDRVEAFRREGRDCEIRWSG